MLKYLLAIAIILLFIILKSINKLKNKVGILFILKTILIVLFLEVTVFNINWSILIFMEMNLTKE